MAGGTMYELFILSKLLHRPMHGYLIQTILNSAIGPFRRLSWGTLYPLMKRLEEKGFIVAVDTSEDDPRGKKMYRTTDAGRSRFLELMNRSGDYDADSSDLFRIKLGCFGHVSEEDRRMILEDYRARQSQILVHTESMTLRVAQATELPSEERRFALLGLDHKQKVAEQEILWIDSLLNKPELAARSMTRVRKGRSKLQS
jgi:DNA-binding PadR family transcriptional regulator